MIDTDCKVQDGRDNKYLEKSSRRKFFWIKWAKLFDSPAVRVCVLGLIYYKTLYVNTIHCQNTLHSQQLKQGPVLYSASISNNEYLTQIAARL